LDRLDLRLLAALLAGLSIGWVGLLQAATVLSIGDGDTIRVMEGGKPITVRPSCIDPPEMAQAPDGINARSYLQSWLKLGSSVTLRPQTVDR
jgi:endonuclease YncB( thermonuclease family)